MSKNKFEVSWSGGAWALCSGSWSIYMNGKNVTKKIPKMLRTSPMGTYGTYNSWHFEGWGEVWESYEDGLKEAEWICESENWLSKISDDPQDWSELFKLIQECDFRVGSCGGCI